MLVAKPTVLHILICTHEGSGGGTTGGVDGKEAVLPHFRQFAGDSATVTFAVLEHAGGGDDGRGVGGGHRDSAGHTGAEQECTGSCRDGSDGADERGGVATLHRVLREEWSVGGVCPAYACFCGLSITHAKLG